VGETALLCFVRAQNWGHYDSQLELEMLEEMIAVINTPENMRIVPKAIYDQVWIECRSIRAQLI
jgi:hypothetical protein